jgi:DNA-binding beta-propeller fold protein YncE
MVKMKKSIFFRILYGVAALTLLCSVAVYKQSEHYLSPTRMAVHPATKEVYVLLSTAQAVAKVNPETEKLLNVFPLDFSPSGICYSADGKTLYITEYSAAGKVHFISPSNGKKKKSIPAGAYPAAICISKTGTQAWVANRFSNDLSVIDLLKRKEVKRLPMVREPKSLALSPDGKILAVGNLLPSQSALDDRVSAQVTLVDTESSEVIGHIPLHDGTQSIEDVCFSKQGDFVFVTHLLSHYTIPATQLERGWMNTNALSLIHVADRKYYATVLLDDMYRGAANPCGMTLSEDGDRLFIAVSGTHELIALSLPLMLQQIKRADREMLASDLRFLNDCKTRIPLDGKGARHVVEKNGKLFVGNYFSGGLSVVDAGSLRETGFVKLGNEPEADAFRKGEQYFADAGICFQNWQSCISCHPDARADGLNWDLINDGIGNPKNTKSLVFAHATPPCMVTGIRPNAEIAVRAGIRHIQFSERPEEDAACMDQYLRSLRPVPSPYLDNGKLTPSARLGEELFRKTGCANCHSGDYYTDGKKYNVGTGVGESTGVLFDTPALREIWRTAPYLYNGSAKTIREALTVFNPKDQHGKTSSLTEKEMDALEEYVLSL